MDDRQSACRTAITHLHAHLAKGAFALGANPIDVMRLTGSPRYDALITWDLAVWVQHRLDATRAQAGHLPGVASQHANLVVRFAMACHRSEVTDGAHPYPLRPGDAVNAAARVSDAATDAWNRYRDRYGN